MKYSLILDDPLVAVANAILVAMMQAWDWDANIPRMIVHASLAVFTVVGICPRISLDRDVRRKLRTVWSLATHDA
jgi:hypothetical protein